LARGYGFSSLKLITGKNGLGDENGVLVLTGIGVGLSCLLFQLVIQSNCPLSSLSFGFINRNVWYFCSI
jgi:hypothetical protein